MYLIIQMIKFFTFAYLSYPDREKGILNLLEAFAIALKKNSNLRLKVPEA